MNLMIIIVFLFGDSIKKTDEMTGPVQSNREPFLIVGRSSSKYANSLSFVGSQAIDYNRE